jgi:hypothetical protein
MMTRKIYFLGAAIAALSVAAPAVQAQEAGIDKRVERLEKEMRSSGRFSPAEAPPFLKAKSRPTRPSATA